MSDRDIREIERICKAQAEEVFERRMREEQEEAFGRMGLLDANGRPDWSALAAPAKGWQKRVVTRQRIVHAGTPIFLGIFVTWFISNSERFLNAVIAIIQYMKGNGP